MLDLFVYFTSGSKYYMLESHAGTMYTMNDIQGNVEVNYGVSKVFGNLHNILVSFCPNRMFAEAYFSKFWALIAEHLDFAVSF